MVEIDRDRKIAELGEPAADVLDVLVHAEDFLDHQHYRQPAALVRHRPVRWYRTGHGLEFHFARSQSLAVGRDGGGSDRLHDLRESLRQQRSYEVAQVGIGWRYATQHGFGHECSPGLDIRRLDTTARSADYIFLRWSGQPLSRPLRTVDSPGCASRRARANGRDRCPGA